jgi:hypothetical protein
MIAGWQKKAGAPATGFLTTAQQQALLREAAPALSKYDEQKLAEEKRKAEERKKAEEEARARASAAVAPDPSQPNVAGAPAAPLPPGQATPAPATASPPGAFDGTYAATTVSPGGGRVTFTLTVTNGRGSLGIRFPVCSTPIAITMSPAGEISGQGNLSCPLVAGATWALVPATITGRARDGKVALTLSTSRVDLSATLDRSGGGTSPAPAQTQPNVAGAASATAAVGPSAPPDGLWRGTYSCVRWPGPSSIAEEFTASLDMQLTNGSGSWKSAGPTSGNGYTSEIRVSAGPTEATITRFHIGASYAGGSQTKLSGQYHGNAIRAAGKEDGTNRQCTLSLTRA